MKASPTQRSKKWLQDQGWQVAIVEHWNPHARIRQDLWGFGDLLACRSPTEERFESILIVQTTSGSHVAARVAKILAEPRARVWVESGGRIVVHGWRKVGPRGKRKVWEVRGIPVTLSDFQDAPLTASEPVA